MYLLYILRAFDIFLYWENISVKRNEFAVAIMHKDNVWVLLLGKDWRYGDQDGGRGSKGTVLRVDANGEIVV
jgi:hypothetical protein